METETTKMFKLLEEGELDQADQKASKLLQKKPMNSHALYIRGVVAKERKDLVNAESFLKKALKYDSRNTFTLLDLAQVYAYLKKIDQSTALLQKLLKLEPKNGLALYLLALNYYKELDYVNAVNTALLALKINSNFPYLRTIIADHYSLNENKFSIALQLLEEEIKLFPNSFNAYRIAGATYARIGDIQKCLDYTRHQIKLTPKDKVAHSNHLNFLHYLPGATNEELLEAANEFYKHCFLDKVKLGKEYDHNRPRNERIRIGFVSGDLRKHAVFYWLREFFKEIGKEDVELYYYCNNKEDEASEEIKESATAWHNVQGIGDIELADLIYEEKIDILFDLSGHTDKNRLEVFLYKPAPVQLTWIGQSGPMGLPQIDYMLADPHSVPEGEEGQYTEKIYRMPHCFAPYGGLTTNVEIEEAPHTKNGYITFGCFNNFIKVNPGVLETWVKILHKVPNSKLFLKSHLFKDEVSLKTVQSFFVQNEITTDRIILEPFDKNRDDYLPKYNQIDIALDPFPVGGSTTTNDLLFMGVPLIAQQGKRMSQRISAAMLSLVGCDELIADSVEDYIEKAVSLANNPDQIDLYKNTLRKKYLNSPQADSKSFTKDFIKACQELLSRL